MLNDRLYIILKKLNNNKKAYINSNELAEILEVSSRTIKRDLKELLDILNHNGATIESTNQGYKILVFDDNSYLKFIDENLNENFDIANRKTAKVNGILELLFSNKYINQDKIADELYISRSSINTVMIDVKSILSKLEIQLQRKPHYGYLLIGNEIKVRNAMVKYLTQRKLNNKIVISKRLEEYDDSFSENLLIEIREIFKKLNIIKNDIEICYITRYIIITIFRIRNNFPIEIGTDIKTSLDNIILSATKEIINRIQKHIDIEFSFEELLYISYIIGNSQNKVNDTTIKRSNVEEMVIDAINEVKYHYDIDFFVDETLIKGLINHLNSSYSRYCLNVTIDNPLIELVKSKYIEAYNYAIDFSNVFNEKYNITMSEDDISYIALHFAAFLERDIIKKNIKIIIVCSSGIGTAELLKIRISKKFFNIEVKGVYPAYMLDSLDVADIDFVVSTVNINNINVEKEIINVSPFLMEEDIEKISEHITRKKDFEYLKSLISEETFFINVDGESKEDVIESMTKSMIENNLISEEISEEIIKREQLSATEINELIAIPHYIAKNNKKSILAIAILKKPILWEKAKVQIVFLGVLDPKIKENRKIFTNIYKLTKNINVVRELIAIDNLSSFKKKIFK